MSPRGKPVYTQLLGLVIAERRRAAGITQELSASRCKLHSTYISQIERGLKTPTVRTLVLIAEVLDTTPSPLLHATEAAAKGRAD